MSGILVQPAQQLLEDRLLTKAELAVYLSVSQGQIDRWVWDKIIPFVQLAGWNTRRFRRIDVLEALHKHGSEESQRKQAHRKERRAGQK